MSLQEKWQLANEFSVGKVNCDGNTLLLGIVHELIPFFGSPRRTKHNTDF